MARRYEHYPGFPGDGDSDTELHHSQPVYWTKSLTVWSIAAVIGLLVLAAVVFWFAL